MSEDMSHRQAFDLRRLGSMARICRVAGRPSAGESEPFRRGLLTAGAKVRRPAGAGASRVGAAGQDLGW